MSFSFNNGYFERVDAEVALVRRFFTSFILPANYRSRKRHQYTADGGRSLHNHEEGSPGELIGIEPHPSPVLKRGFPGFTELILKCVQDVPLDLFRSLEAGDILFIDSSHVVAVAVTLFTAILHILPKLKPGVIRWRIAMTYSFLRIIRKSS